MFFQQLYAAGHHKTGAANELCVIAALGARHLNFPLKGGEKDFLAKLLNISL